MEGEMEATTKTNVLIVIWFALAMLTLIAGCSQTIPDDCGGTCNQAAQVEDEDGEDADADDDSDDGADEDYEDEDNDSDDDADSDADEDDDEFELWAARQDEDARINIEFIPDWADPGDFGWHAFKVDTEGDVRVSLSEDEVDEILEDEGFDADDVMCVRYNVTFGEDCEEDPDEDHCEWLFEGNGDSAHDTGDYEFDGPGDWDDFIWSDPDGEGSSGISCRD